MAPGAATRVDYRMRLQANGFSANDRRPEIVGNGSLIANDVVIPSIGYPRHLELRSPSVRRDAGLAPHRTQPNLHNRPLIPSGSARMTLSATISTAAEQTIVAPGRLLNTWTAHSRRLFLVRDRADDRRTLWVHLGSIPKVDQANRRYDSRSVLSPLSRA